MAFGLKLSFVMVFLLVLFQEGKPLKCYQCSSSLHGDCDDPLNSTKVTFQTCSGSHKSCLLLNVTENGNTEIRRECADNDFCEKTRNVRAVLTSSRSCRTCSWGLCNSAPAIMVPSISVGIASLLLIKYYL